jgi:hypothetical protein
MRVKTMVSIQPNADYGDIMLKNGTVMHGSWITNLTDQQCHLTDDAGKEWWFDIDDIIALSPQVKT